MATMNQTTSEISKGKDLAYLTQQYVAQQYVAAKPSTAATEVDLTPSTHHSRHNSAVQPIEDIAKEEARKKSSEGRTQTVELNRVRETNDGTKGHAPRAKTSKNVKAM